MKRSAKRRKSRKTRAQHAEIDAAIAAIKAVADEVKAKRRSQKVDRSTRRPPAPLAKNGSKLRDKYELSEN
jgi:hypothetical protein